MKIESKMRTPNGELEARIAVAKCKETKGKTYGVRFQRSGDIWKYNWAFEMRESSAKREGYDQTKIKGNIFPDAEYPGCPYCGVKYFIICDRCSGLSCNTVIGNTVTCEWCGMTGTIERYSGGGIASGGDRG